MNKKLIFILGVLLIIHYFLKFTFPDKEIIINYATAILFIIVSTILLFKTVKTSLGFRLGLVLTFVVLLTSYFII